MVFILCASPFWLPVPDFFEDGIPLPAQAYLKVCSAMSEASLTDLKTSNLAAATSADSPAKEAEPQASATTVQRTSVLHTEEIVRVSERSWTSQRVLLLRSCALSCSPSDQVAGQSHVDQAGDHHGDAEHPPGGQERQGEEVPHNLRGDETSGQTQAGGSSQHLRAGRRSAEVELRKEWVKSCVSWQLFVKSKQMFWKCNSHKGVHFGKCLFAVRTCCWICCPWLYIFNQKFGLLLSIIICFLGFCTILGVTETQLLTLRSNAAQDCSNMTHLLLWLSVKSWTGPTNSPTTTTIESEGPVSLWHTRSRLP